MFKRILVAVGLVCLLCGAAVPARAADLVLNRYSTADGLAGNFVTAIAFEPNGSAWVGTIEGVTHISDAGWVSYTAQHGLGDDWVTAIAVAPDGRVWLGTQSGGLDVLDPTTRTITGYALDNSDIPSNFVTALAVDPENRVWVGTLNQGLGLYDVAADAWTHIPDAGESITALVLDGDGQPMVGTPNGVYAPTGDGWQRDASVGNANVRRIDAFGGSWFLTTDDARFVLSDEGWQALSDSDEIGAALDAANLTDEQVTAFAKDEQGRYWLGTPRGLVLASHGNAPTAPKPLPVVLVHGWTVAGDDTLESSEFKYLKSYADRDGIPMFYAVGVSPENTLYQNAVAIRDAIAQAKQATGADKVNLIGFSMGGMNSRAYLESSLYDGDVNRVIILGTPQAGVELWKPILVEQILAKHAQPSAVELSPEYADLVRQNRQPNPSVAYDLLIGDVNDSDGMGLLKALPPSDALISVASALGQGFIELPDARKHVNNDLHDWSPQPVPLDLSSYLYPRNTYERYLRNALRDATNAPLGSEIAEPSAPHLAPDFVPNHTPVVTEPLAPGATNVRTVVVDANESARFIAYYPGGEVKFSLVAPNGKVYETSDLPRDDGTGVTSLSADIASFTGFAVDNAQPGEWRLMLTRKDEGDAPLDVSTFAELRAPRSIRLTGSGWGQQVGEPRPITVHAPRGAKLAARIAIPSAEPGGAFIFQELPLFDDGAHGDGAAQDGEYGNVFTPERSGWYVVQVNVAGIGWERGAEALFAVNATGARLGESANRRTENGKVIYELEVQSERAGPFLLSARLQGKSYVMPLELVKGANRVSLPFDAARLTGGAGTLELMLMDGQWAAVPIERREIAVEIPSLN